MMDIEENLEHIHVPPLGQRLVKGRIGACPHKFCLWRPVRNKPGAWCRWHIKAWAAKVLARADEERKDAEWEQLKGLEL